MKHTFQQRTPVFELIPHILPHLQNDSPLYCALLLQGRLNFLFFLVELHIVKVNRHFHIETGGFLKLFLSVGGRDAIQSPCVVTVVRVVQSKSTSVTITKFIYRFTGGLFVRLESAHHLHACLVTSVPF